MDVYHDWLGITETQRPLSYYQLLRVKPFEDDLARIRSNYQKMNAHVRKFATGDYAQQSQQLLNELAKAMLCLTDSRRKREYDASLGRKDAGEGRRRTLEEILLAGKKIDAAQLTKARNYAKAIGLETRDALVQQKLATADVVMLAYAESLGLPYIELADVGVDEKLVPQIPPTLARQHSCLPVMVDEGQLLMASPNPLVPEVEEELRLRMGIPVRSVLCTAGSINELIGKYYPRDAVGPAAPGKKPAGKATAKPAAARPVDEPGPSAPPVSRDEEIRRRALAGIVAFNITVIVCIFVMVFIRGGLHLLSFMNFVLAFLIATLVGGAAFAIATFMKR